MVVLEHWCVIRAVIMGSSNEPLEVDCRRWVPHAMNAEGGEGEEEAREGVRISDGQRTEMKRREEEKTSTQHSASQMR